MKKWKAEPLGLIKFLLFNKYPGIRSVLENDSTSLSPGTSERCHVGFRATLSFCLSLLSPFSHLLLHLLKPTAVMCRARLCAPTHINLISSSLVSAIIGSFSVKQTSFFFFLQETVITAVKECCEHINYNRSILACQVFASAYRSVRT